MENQTGPKSIKLLQYDVFAFSPSPHSLNRIATEVMTKEKQTVISGLPDGPQYRVKVRPYDLSGLGTPSEGVMYPEVEDDASKEYITGKKIVFEKKHQQKKGMEYTSRLEFSRGQLT